MNHVRSCFGARVIGMFLACALVLSPSLSPQLAAASGAGVKVLNVKGSATTTITSLVPINDVMLRIEASQTGKLTYFGKFTGAFSYLAILTPFGFVIVGNATLTNQSGEKLFVTASILEIGLDYPYTVTGVLTVTGGTGQYAGATGSIGVSGEDNASPDDMLNLNGTIVTVK